MATKLVFIGLYIFFISLFYYFMSNQVELVSLEELVSHNHIYRNFKELWNLEEVKNQLDIIEVGSDYFLLCFCNLWKI